MKKRTLGKTGLQVSPIGLGAWAISGRGYGTTDDRESIQVLHKALDMGVDFIDTADSYGDGHSEELIGNVLRERRDSQTIVATKVGWDFYVDGGIKSNLTREYIEFAAEQSLVRLKRDVIDLYQIHNSNPHAIERDAVVETLQRLKEKGKIRFWGISANYVKDGVTALEKWEPDTIQVAYNIFNREAEEPFIPLAEAKNTGVIIREPLACGLLTGKYDAESTFEKNDHRRGWNKKVLEQGAKDFEKIRFLGKPNRTVVQAAILFALSPGQAHVVIPGAKMQAQVVENIEALDYELGEQEIELIKSLKFE